MTNKYISIIKEGIEQETRLLELYIRDGDWPNVTLQKEYIKGLRQALLLIEDNEVIKQGEY
ncbi:MAG: hypothetical protein ACW97P_10655 [Candidatus Hodarchaeales archaeon]|jgi:hypothetical protein